MRLALILVKSTRVAITLCNMFKLRGSGIMVKAKGQPSPDEKECMNEPWKFLVTFTCVCSRGILEQVLRLLALSPPSFP